MRISFYLPPPPPATAAAIGHPRKRAFMLVFRVLTFSGHDHNDDDAENRGDGCASPILQQGTFSFEITNDMYLLTISSPPTGCCSPPTPILSTTRRAPPWHINTTSSLENERICSFSRVVTLYHHHHHLSASKTSTHARFRGWLLFTTTLIPENKRVCLFSRAVVLCHHHHPRKQAYVLVFEPGCSLPPLLLPRKRARTLVFKDSCSLPPPPPSSVENEHTRSFSRLVALCHHHHHP